MDISDLRNEYGRAGLLEADADPDPIRQFGVWFAQALAAGLAEPNAMTLATVSAAGIPAARIVLLKGFSDEGFTFFSNYQSRKGRELAENPRAALVLFWAELERQVRIEGTVAFTSDRESDEYFAMRPRGSQLGAWVSGQSEVIASREVLERSLAQIESEFGDRSIARPPHWGGYRLWPLVIEFWQGRPDRLHDRLIYRRGDKENSWTRERLSP